MQAEGDIRGAYVYFGGMPIATPQPKTDYSRLQGDFTAKHSCRTGKPAQLCLHSGFIHLLTKCKACLCPPASGLWEALWKAGAKLGARSQGKITTADRVSLSLR
jgi:hypothetical protein